VVAKQAMHAQNRPCTHGRSLVASGLLSKNRACDLPLPRDSSHVPLPHSSPLLWSSPSSIRRLQLQVDHNAAQIHLPAPLDLIFASRSAPPHRRVRDSIHRRRRRSRPGCSRPRSSWGAGAAQDGGLPLLRQSGDPEQKEPVVEMQAQGR
jgi:hypothetical protein